MTYRDAVKQFKNSSKSFQKGSGTDYWTAQQAWSEYTDSLCRDGEITQKQYNTWSTPFKYGKRL